ncbi:MAG: hypothetical protein ONB46_02590 [candidate division KSB1 bacterium]|nr:hypothetical protein [candidate division KSB1 bacterium]MDZ7364877.1 hypothetical protein [candidate division KSB1 bacterium]MDZ7402980.1 hypothetical protein [candidate division KSB1 bacterium]
MSVGQTYLLVMGIVILFALLGGFYIMWNAREEKQKKSKAT